MSSGGKPILKLLHACGRIGGRKAAIVKSQFQRPLSDFFLHVPALECGDMSPFGSRKAELMNHLLGDFADMAQFRVQQHVGLAVKRLASGK